MANRLDTLSHRNSSSTQQSTRKGHSAFALVALFLAVTSIALAVAPASADIVDPVFYYRFEDGTGTSSGIGLDSGPNGYDLTVPAEYGTKVTHATDIDPTHIIIKQTGEANTGAVDFASDASAGNFFTKSDETDFHQNDFTVEAFVTPQNATDTRCFFGMVHSTGSDAQFAMGWDPINAQLMLFLSEDGTTVERFNMDLALDPVGGVNGNADWVGKLLYFGASVSVDAINGTTIDMWYKHKRPLSYRQDLTITPDAGGTADQMTLAGITSLHDSTSALEIGGGQGTVWDGRIDEVRYTAALLDVESQILEVPEPAALSLLAIGLVAGIGCRSRNRRLHTSKKARHAALAV